MANLLMDNNKMLGYFYSFYGNENITQQEIVLFFNSASY